jgi:hypothetical protein
MLKEAIDRIAELGVEASGIETCDLYDRKFVLRKGTAFEILERDPPEAKYETLDCPSFVSLVNALGEDPLVLIDCERVVGILDESKKRGRVYLGLEKSRAAKALTALGNPTDQKKLIGFLREELAGCVEEKFLAIVRRLDFSRRNDGNSSIQHGRESLGRSVEAAVQSAEGQVPEIVVVTLPAWGSIEFDSTIQLRCAVHVDAVAEKISIRPIGEELEIAVNFVMSKLQVHLLNLFSDEGNDTQVVLGSTG